MKKPTKILLIIASIIAVLVLFFAFISAKDKIMADKLKQSLQNLKHNQEITLEKVAPFKWDKFYVFGPYFPKEEIEKEIGFKSHKIQESHQDSDWNYFFVKDRKVVLNQVGYNKLGYSIYLADRKFIKNGDNVKFKVTKKDKITHLNIIDKNMSELPLKINIKDLYKSKNVMFYSYKEEKWQNFNLYQSFKKRVNKKESASFRFIKETVEGDPIIYDIYYDKRSGFTVIKDNRRDKFSAKKDRRIFGEKYKYFYESHMLVDSINKKGGFMTVAILSNKDNLDQADSDETSDTIRLFSYKMKKSG